MLEMLSEPFKWLWRKLTERPTIHAEDGGVGAAGDIHGDISTGGVHIRADVVQFGVDERARDDLESELAEIRDMLKDLKGSNAGILDRLLRLPAGIAHSGNELSSEDLVVVSIQSAIARSGEAVMVDLSAELPYRGLGAYSIDVFYDSEKLQAIESMSHPAGVSNPKFTPNVVRFVGATIDGIRGKARLGTVKFRVKPGAVGSAGLHLAIGELVDPNGEPLQANIVQFGFITIDGADTPRASG